MSKIDTYVWCVNCKCSVHDWETYAWHSDQGHKLLFGDAATGQRSQPSPDPG